MHKQESGGKACLLVLASTYPRWQGDPEPGFVHELSRRLADRFRVIVLCPHAPGAQPREILDEVEVVRYRYAPERWETLVNDGGIVTNLKLHRWKLLLVPGFILMQTWRAWRLCKREKVDVIHAHWLIPQGLIAALLPRPPGRSKVPFMVTSHGADLYALKGRWMDALKRFVLRRAAAATVVSRAMLEAVMTIDADADKVSVMSMGVDMCGRFTPDPSVTRTANEVLFVGRLVEKKGLRHLLDAFPLVLKARPDTVLTVAGFGPEQPALERQAQALGLMHAMRFLGPVPQAELPTLYRRAAVCVAPFVQAASGDQEGLGLVLVEAAGCGCPILAGRVPALGEVLGSGFGDMTVDSRNARQLSERILAALADPEGWQIRAQALREAIMEKFEWRTVSERYTAQLNAAAGSKDT